MTIPYLHVLSFPYEQPVDVACEAEGEDYVEDGGQDREGEVDVAVFRRPPKDVGYAVRKPQSLPDVDDS